MHPLPDKLSDLLRLALEDARAVAALPNHRFNMERWITNYKSGACETCLGGAVLLNSLQVSLPDPSVRPVYSLESGNLGEKVINSIRRLNDFRQGEWYEMVKYHHNSFDLPEELQDALQDLVAPPALYFECSLKEIESFYAASSTKVLFDLLEQYDL